MTVRLLPVVLQFDNDSWEPMMISELADLSLEAAIQLDKKARQEPYTNEVIKQFADSLEAWSPRKVENTLRGLRHVSLLADAMKGYPQHPNIGSLDDLLSGVSAIQGRLGGNAITEADAASLRDFCLSLNRALLAEIQNVLDRRRWYSNIGYE